MASERSSRVRTKVDYTKLDNVGKDDDVAIEADEIKVKRRRKAPPVKKSVNRGENQQRSVPVPQTSQAPHIQDSLDTFIAENNFFSNNNNNNNNNNSAPSTEF